MNNGLTILDRAQHQMEDNRGSADRTRRFSERHFNIRPLEWQTRLAWQMPVGPQATCRIDPQARAACKAGRFRDGATVSLVLPRFDRRGFACDLYMAHSPAGKMIVKMHVICKSHSCPATATKSQIAAHPDCIDARGFGGLKDLRQNCRTHRWSIGHIMDRTCVRIRVKCIREVDC